MHSIGILVVFLLIVMAFKNGKSLRHDKIVVCPTFPQWYLDRNRNQFNIDQAAVNCTHIQILDFYNQVGSDYEDDLREIDIKRIVNLRQKNPNLKAITLCKEITEFFEEYLDYNYEGKSVNQFFEIWIFYLKEGNLDGLDLDFGNMQEK